MKRTMGHPGSLGNVDPSGRSHQKQKKDFWDVLDVISKFVMPAVLVYLGWVATGRVDNYVKQRQLEITSAKEMSATFAALLRSDEKGEAIRYAVELSNFGQQAILPLVFVFQGSHDIRANAASTGLELLTTVEKSAVCARIARIIDNQSRLHSFVTYKKAVQFVARVECADSQPSLAAAKARVQGMLNDRTGPTIFSNREEIGQDKLRDLIADIEESLTVLSSVQHDHNRPNKN